MLSRARLRHAHACAQLTTISCTSRVYLFLAQLGQLAFAAAPRHDLLFPGLVDALFLRFQCFLVKHCKVGHRQSSLGALPEAPGQRLEPIPAHIPFRTLPVLVTGRDRRSGTMPEQHLQNVLVCGSRCGPHCAAHRATGFQVSKHYRN